MYFTISINVYYSVLYVLCVRTLAINEEIIQHDWDILAITETWLKQTGDEAIVTELLSPGYTFHHVARSRGRGGGVGVVYRNTYNTKILPKLHFTTIELIRLQFTKPFLLKYNLLVYHPPATSKTSGTLSDFYSELEQLFTEASISVIPTVIVGDFNVHFDDTLKSEPLRTLLESYNLTQHVHSLTHQTGHILDLVVSQTDDNFITSVTVHPDSLSDHHSIELKLRALKPAVQTNTITKRDFRNIDVDALRSDITSVCSDTCACTNDRQADELVHVYNTCFTASTNMPHGVTCGYETHHTPGMTLTSMLPGIKSENRRMCGEEQNWRFIDNYTSPPGMNVLR